MAPGRPIQIIDKTPHHLEGSLFQRQDVCDKCAPLIGGQQQVALGQHQKKSLQFLSETTVITIATFRAPIANLLCAPYHFISLFKTSACFALWLRNGELVRAMMLR